MDENKIGPSFNEAFKFWLKLGFISFGGPAGQIAVMQKELVENRQWIDNDDFLHALNYCMLLPGPEAQQLATYCGWKLHGIKGGIVAGAFFVIPSIFFLLLLSYIYANFGSVPQIDAVLDGFKAVVVAIVVEAVIKIGKKAFKSKSHLVMAALAFVAIYFFHIPFPLIVLGAFVIGFVYSRFQVSNSNLEESKINSYKAKNNLLKIITVCFALWLIPFIILVLIYGYENLTVKTYLFFTQSAFVTFGGAYTVLAYVNQAVVANGWVTSAQTVDGLALAETTPGPLIMVLQFIGFMAGWNASNSPPFAILCALLTTYVTFLPSFLFIFAGANYIEKLRNNQTLNSSLSFVTASVVGVILNLALMFGATVVYHNSNFDWFALILAAISFISLYFLKADVLLVVIVGGLCGLAKYFLIG
ncbi:MAG TPA: chromate efflux transporter [Pyrinomonadaceae bacterium]|nr:chromate efflux transporter [Pyrinomonadaceae bacterium]